MGLNFAFKSRIKTQVFLVMVLAFLTVKHRISQLSLSPMSNPTLPTLVTELRTLLSDELGRTVVGRVAIGVEGQVQQAVSGVTCVVRVMPDSTRDSGKVTGGTYHGDLWCIDLVGKVGGDRSNNTPLNIASAVRKIQNKYNVLGGVTHMQEQGEQPEQAMLKVFLPALEKAEV